MTDIDFAGRVAVVTGAGAGLGRAYALELSRRGAAVVVNDPGVARDGSGQTTSRAADDVVQEISEQGGKAVASYHSVADPDGGKAIVDTALSAFGRVDILICNAGILRDKTVLKMEPDDWRSVLAVHLDGAFHVIRPAFARMREQEYGRIILTTSAAGLYGNFGQTNYGAAKLGLVGLLNTLEIEGAKYGIRSNAVAPVAATRMTEDILPPELFARLRAEFVVPLVLYLVSDHCAESGKIYNAAMGRYNRVAVMNGPGVVVGDRMTPPKPEEIAENWEGINSLSGAREFSTALELMSSMLGDDPE